MIWFFGVGTSTPTSHQRKQNRFSPLSTRLVSRRFIPPEVPPVVLPPNEKIIWNSHPLNPPMADLANLKVKSALFKKQNKRRP